MNGESTLRMKAREAIQTGRLPCRAPQRMWGGPGIGAYCPICEKSAGRDEVEFELEFVRQDDDSLPNSYHVHVQCLAAWELERQNFDSVGGTALFEQPRLPTPLNTPRGGGEASTVNGSLPASSNGRRIAGHDCDTTDGRGTA
jgi:hypothetical protein